MVPIEIDLIEIKIFDCEEVHTKLSIKYKNINIYLNALINE